MTGVSFKNGSASLAYSGLSDQAALSGSSSSGNGGGGDDDDDDDTPKVVDILDLTSYVTAPAVGATPVASLAGGSPSQYTGAVTWSPADSVFAAARVYTATVTLTAGTSYTFTGLTANSFSHSGATTVVASPISADSATVTITFPITDSGTPVDDLDLANYVTAPVRGVAPVPSLAGSPGQYTGDIVWKTADDNMAHTGIFGSSTVYKAIVTLEAEDDYTFTGLTANSFDHTGKTAITTSDISADRATVTITFPATSAPPESTIEIGNPTVKIYLDKKDGSSKNLVEDGGSTSIPVGRGSFTVSIDEGSTDIKWYVNSTQTGKTGTSLDIHKVAGTYHVTVEATQGGEKQSGRCTFKVE
jgi:hypothetical protein